MLKKIILFLFLIPLNCLASVTEPLDWLLVLGIVPRASSMGSAFTAISNDSSAFYWNPSGAVMVKEKLFSLNISKSSYRGDVFSGDISLLVPFNKYTLGVSYCNIGYFYEDYVFETAKIVNKDPLLKNTNNLNLLGATKISRDISMGVVIKIIEKQYHESDKKSYKYGMNIGSLYSSNGIRFGLSVNNIGEKETFFYRKSIDPLKMRIGLGISSKNNNIFSTDIEFRSDEKHNICVGYEYKINKDIDIRMGYKIYNKEIYNKGELISGDDTKGLNLGIGWNIKKFNIDCSFSYYTTMRLTSRISVNSNF